MNSKKKLTLFNILGGVLCIIFLPIIFVNLMLIIDSYRNPDDMPGVFGVTPVVVLSGSMEPTIQTGDLILLHEADAAALQEGDVICYLSSGSATTHRIVDITTNEDGQTQYITQGDANNAEDLQPVLLDQIQGVWQGQRVAKLGEVSLFMQTPAGIIVCLVCPLLLFILWDVFRRRQHSKVEAARTVALEAELAALKSTTDAADKETSTAQH